MAMDKIVVCGIDEAGRGCLAGDLVVAGVVLLEDIDGLDDSKKLSFKKREELYDKIIQKSIYHVVSIKSKTIDKTGLSLSINSALEDIISNIQADNYIFDGNSTFGVLGLQTLVKADMLIQEVKAASIVAKVTRDRAILSLPKEFDKYEFNKHKGYGTKRHKELISIYGPSIEHRKSFKGVR